MLVFTPFPILLLLLYPVHFFQQCPDCCRVRWHALPIDAFQGCYKVGTNGTREIATNLEQPFLLPGVYSSSFLLSVIQHCSILQQSLFSYKSGNYGHRHNATLQTSV